VAELNAATAVSVPHRVVRRPPCQMDGSANVGLPEDPGAMDQNHGGDRGHASTRGSAKSSRRRLDHGIDHRSDTRRADVTGVTTLSGEEWV